jgi:hypothetical protein
MQSPSARLRLAAKRPERGEVRGIQISDHTPGTGTG